MICVLAGGVGAAKLLRGLQKLDLDEEIVAIVNTGDDENFYGLKVCPDLDSVTYALAGISNQATGWGVADESFQALEMLRRLGDDAWFTLGDRDLGTHLYRARRLGEGATLTEVTDEIRLAHEINVVILPMSDSDVRTYLDVETGPEHLGTPAERTTISFQSYFVKHRHQPTVHGVHYWGAERAKVNEAALNALRDARLLVIAPSNPILSIGPILSIDPIASALRARRESTVAVSPIIGGKAIKGPADRILRSIWGESSVGTVARIYAEFASDLIVDHQDETKVEEIQHLGMNALVTSTLMHDADAEMSLGEFIAQL